jgi:hypothetical protein
MPKIRRQDVPEAILRHLTARICERSIPVSELVLFSNWLAEEPEVPSGKWFKRFPNMTVCGEGELVKTFLTPQQFPFGHEVESPTQRTPGLPPQNVVAPILPSKPKPSLSPPHRPPEPPGPTME